MFENNRSHVIIQQRQLLSGTVKYFPVHGLTLGLVLSLHSFVSMKYIFQNNIGHSAHCAQPPGEMKMMKVFQKRLCMQQYVYCATRGSIARSLTTIFPFKCKRIYSRSSVQTTAGGSQWIQMVKIRHKNCCFTNFFNQFTEVLFPVIECSSYKKFANLFLARV